MDPVDTSHVPLTGDSREQDGLLNPDPEQPARRVDSKVTRGFYLYSWAVEVYAVVSLTLFLPVALEEYARESGYLASDISTPCMDRTSVCSVYILGVWMNTASFSLYTYSLSVLLQAITVIAVSKRANDASTRRKLMFLFTLMGSASCVAFLFISPQTLIWPITAILTIIGNIAFGASIVCLNAYLPSLAQGVVRSKITIQLEDGVVSDNMESLTVSNDDFSKATTMISKNGIAAGYGAGILLLLITMIPVSLMEGSLFSLRIAVAVSGIWWLAFGIPALAFFPSTIQSGSLPPSSTSQSGRELLSILKQYRQIPETFKYLAAWFIMSDAFATITSTAVLFAKITLGMQPQQLIWVGVLTPLCGIAGALAWPKLQHGWLRTTDLETLRIIVALSAVIPLWGLVALNTEVELLLLACYFGALYGALQSYSRACFSHLIPPSEEARFFALYSITDKSSSFIGPAVVAVIADQTGSVRAGFLFLLIAILMSLPLLQRVDMDKGRKDATYLKS